MTIRVFLEGGRSVDVECCQLDYVDDDDSLEMCKDDGEVVAFFHRYLGWQDITPPETPERGM